MEKMFLPLNGVMQDSAKLTANNLSLIFWLTWPFILFNIVDPYLLTDLTISNAPAIVIYGIALLLLSAITAFNCHQIFLLKSETKSSLSWLHWGSRNTCFLFKFLQLGVVSTLLFMPMIIVSGLFLVNNYDKHSAYIGLFNFCAMLPVAYFIARFSLVLPDAAVGKQRSLRWSWRVSKGHSLRLFLLLGFIPGVLGFALHSLTEIITNEFIVECIDTLIYLVIALMEVCFLSVSYRYIVNHNADPEKAEMPKPQKMSKAEKLFNSLIVILIISIGTFLFVIKNVETEPYIVSYGLINTDVVDINHLTKDETFFVTRDGYEQSITRISKQIGTEFGIEVYIPKGYSDKPLQVESGFIFPKQGLLDPEQGRIFSDLEIIEFEPGSFQPFSYIIEDDWEAIAGMWKFQLKIDGELTIEKEFLLE
ncbi:DUF3859 domain-containing protein [Thalassotalea psychrophila]|uniref:DUF3859 domain-containing protein n=1 Tax=Thalassotalea psychrophila TaxID=3065647 RepID=A0ABY9TRW0_9GAMM|nr:DUF3859 domain-containing protein [Colwelliaceae bacterium SQ149]